MRLTKKLLKKSNLSIIHFSKLIGSTPRTINKYLAKNKVLDVTKKKIETGAEVIKDLDLVFPTVQYTFDSKHSSSKYNKDKKMRETLDNKFKKEFKKRMK